MACSTTIDPHPLADLFVFESHFPRPVGEMTSDPKLLAGQSSDFEAPLSTNDEVKRLVRDLLRHGGFKPTGRNKPASEYLIKAVDSGWLSPQHGINLAVDACNVTSLHSGLPISVIDLALATPPLRIGVCPPGTRYVFNPTGQVIDVSKLLSLHDGAGACAGPVKDSQRTKTSDTTRRTLSVIWGTNALPGRTAQAAEFYLGMLHAAGVTTTSVQQSGLGR